MAEKGPPTLGDGWGSPSSGISEFERLGECAIYGDAGRDRAETQRDSVSWTPQCTTEPADANAHPARKTPAMSEKARWLHKGSSGCGLSTHSMQSKPFPGWGAQLPGPIRRFEKLGLPLCS